ncbi:ABC transporter permease [Ferruginibacter sp.]|nr:ABC transporter permease subunit [Ferruginibacter sp.]
MIELLKIEWLKLKNYTAFKVLAIFFGVGVVAVNYVIYIINREVVQQVPVPGVSTLAPYGFDMTWHTTSYATGCILLLPAMLLAILITNEYGYKTHRQNIIDGLTRQQFIGVKLMMALIFALVATVLVFFTALIFGLFSGTSFSFNGIANVGYFFLKTLTYNLFAVLVSVLVKRTGFVIGLLFIYMGAENFISQLLWGLSIYLKREKNTDLGNMGDYLPLNAVDGLLEFPDNTIKTLSKTVMPQDITWLVFTLAMVYLVLFFLWAKRKFVKSDL